MIKWEHSIFALPFALTAVLLAAHGLPRWRTLGWILVAMVAARSAAMAFNRWADADLDAANPRTTMRAIPAGLLTRNNLSSHSPSRPPVVFPHRGRRTQPANALSFAHRAAGAAWLQLHEAHHPLVASGAGALVGAGTFGRVDRRARQPRSQDRGAHWGGHALGRRFRRALRVPGF